MHILQPARTTYVTTWQVNASSTWTRPLVNHLTSFLVIFYRVMGLLTREEEKRFPREREILTVESSKRTKDNTRQPSISLQRTARGLVQVEVVRRREKPERRLVKRMRVVSDDEGDLEVTE
ncbi:hypothetical protein AXG93_295s1000 [Marchantia polymorpha subsp. ruderalis]|uniref:Uncharacterized protein n=1 Tax=Marchantia polymorpha subsp. ruderalis TaxID=1480154 RepID=A0A176VYF6_MARPO|nr:hypothetical protein AXG93_295s1000 [Marchantia polymorpha subsp. ruderalis]